MLKVLVVDDDILVRNSMKVALESLHLDVATANDGAQALEYVSYHTVDLVITDIIMPNKDGIEIILDLQKINPDIKIIAMTGGGRFGSHNYLEIAAELGASYILKKPVSFDKLKEVIDNLLEDSGK